MRGSRARGGLAVITLAKWSPPVGIVLPSRDYASPIIAFVGVLPDRRGHGYGYGYGYDLLVEGTHVLVEAGA